MRVPIKDRELVHGSLVSAEAVQHRKLRHLIIRQLPTIPHQLLSPQMIPCLEERKGLVVIQSMKSQGA